MRFVGLRKDKETEEIIQYELKVNTQEINCIYQDRYGVYICTQQGRMYKVDHNLAYVTEELGL